MLMIMYFSSRGISHLNPVTLMPEDEKHTLLENIEIEVEEVKRPSMKTEDG